MSKPKKRGPGRPRLFSTPSVTIRSVMSKKQRAHVRRIGGKLGLSHGLRTIVDAHMAAQEIADA